ncbi:ABC transporter permease [Burkholderia sp. Ac-20379]|uniref:ABC transporter permease n=1 Tax=Burkholderia sp. Ac-20379 TaxID=2703900 RepID=UPI0019807B53|nr:ABC transporter permease [Burkholderia sp. Ac-20379]MBN3724562.1 ABC transporter permease [Burkholderia sp. Ac-20379]
MSDTAISIRERAQQAAATADAPRAKPALRRRAAAIGWAVAPWLLPAALFALWTIGCERGWIAPQILPPPEAVWQTLAELARSGDLLSNTWISLQRVFFGFAAGSLAGFAIGAWLGLSRTAEAYVLPSFNAIVQIPVLGWLPFLLLLVGVGEPLKIILIAHAALVPVAMSTLQGFRETPPALDEAARVFGYSRFQRIVHVVLPAAVPTLATGVRLAFTKAWLALVVVELVASSEGLGYLIVYGRQLFQLDLVMAAVVIVGAIGYAINRLLDALEARLRRGRASAFRA